MRTYKEIKKHSESYANMMRDNFPSSFEDKELNKLLDNIVFDDEKSFSKIEAGEKKKKSITIEADDLKSINFTEIKLNADKTRDPAIEFEVVEAVIKAKYSLGLISFKVKIEDYDLGGLE